MRVSNTVPSLFGAETVKDCVALAWDRATFRGLVACHPARQRLAQVLVSLAKGIGQVSVERGGRSELRVLQETR